MNIEITFYVVDNTRVIENLLIEAVMNNHRIVMDQLVSLAKTNCPVDTGALREAIYQVGPWGSGYDQAVSRAASVSYTQITERDQIGPPLTLTSGQRGVWLAAIDIPLAYAIFVHNGYYNILAERVMPPNPFLLDAFIQVWSDQRFLVMCQKDFQRILRPDDTYVLAGI